MMVFLAKCLQTFDVVTLPIDHVVVDVITFMCPFVLVHGGMASVRNPLFLHRASV